MIEHTISVIVNENVDKIMNFILNNMDDYVNTGKIKSIRKVETHEILDISSTKLENDNNNIKKIKRFYFFASILPEFINNIIGEDNLDLFLTYNEEIIFDFNEKTSTTVLEQVNNFYSGKYDVKYNKIDNNTTSIEITFNFELLLQTYNFLTFSTIIETIISQIFIAEMKKFYTNLNDDIKTFNNKKYISNNKC
jgi:hypothetical protein